MLPEQPLLYGEDGYELAPLLEQLGDWQPDILLWWGLNAPLPRDLERLAIPRLLIAADWQYHFGVLRHYCRAFDWIYGDRLLLQSLKGIAYHQASYWSAYSFDPETIAYYPAPERDIDVAFMGSTSAETYGQRNRYLWRLAALNPAYRVLIRSDLQHPFYSMLLSRSKMVFNYSLRREMNLRAYEATTCGALLLVERENLEVREILGQGCVVYDQANFESQIEYYLSHEAERQAIAELGQQKIRDYSYQAQFESLLQDIQQRFAQAEIRPVRESGSASQELILRALQLNLTNLPEFQAQAVELLAAITQPDAQLLNALAVLRMDYEGLIQQELAPRGLKPDYEALTALLSAQQDLLSQHNLAWIALAQRRWELLEDVLPRLVALLQQFEAGLLSLPLSEADLWLPVRYTALPGLRQSLLSQFASQPEELQARWARLLSWTCWFLQGNLCLAQMRLEPALQAFGEACRVQPEIAEGWFELARCCQAFKQPQLAIQALESGLEQGVYYPGVWLGLIQLLRAQGLNHQAQQRLNQARVLFQDAAYKTLWEQLGALS